MLVFSTHCISEPKMYWRYRFFTGIVYSSLDDLEKELQRVTHQAYSSIIFTFLILGFFSKVMNSDLSDSCEIFPDKYTLLKKQLSHFTSSSSNSFNNSLFTLSDPLDFPIFIHFIASLTSSTRTSGPLSSVISVASGLVSENS